MPGDEWTPPARGLRQWSGVGVIVTVALLVFHLLQQNRDLLTPFQLFLHVAPLLGQPHQLLAHLKQIPAQGR
jgi:hypothetical protein